MTKEERQRAADEARQKLEEVQVCIVKQIIMLLVFLEIRLLVIVVEKLTNSRFTLTLVGWSFQSSSVYENKRHGQKEKRKVE